VLGGRGLGVQFGLYLVVGFAAEDGWREEKYLVMRNENIFIYCKYISHHGSGHSNGGKG